jgi:hypothetical protein
MVLNAIRLCLMALICAGVIQAVRHFKNFPANSDVLSMLMADVGLMLFASVCIIIVNLIEERKTNKNEVDPGYGKTRDIQRSGRF